MKSDKKLLEVYNEAKGDNEYYQFERFKSDVKDFLKDIKNYKVICSMTVSRSGMTRHFNFDSYNMLLNICYNQKNNWGNVRVGVVVWICYGIYYLALAKKLKLEESSTSII